MTRYTLLLLLLPLLAGALTRQSLPSRRDALAFVPVATIAASASVANAFDNKISSKYDDRPKRRGSQPPGLGVATRQNFFGDDFLGLKNCGAAPNCFCSTMTVEDDADHSIPPFVWPSKFDQKQAMQELAQVLQSYPPGQNNVDGGGFAIKKVQDDYIYVQYESLKNGYIDDVEFAVIPGYGDCQVQVRSSSRLGYLDFGVNAKRLNWIAKALRERGWQAEGVNFEKHAGYALENQI